MLVDVKVPSVGESITEGLLLEWSKQNGDFIQADDSLFVLETDKAAITVSAPTAGLLKILTPAGDMVLIGQVVATIDTGGTRAVDQTSAEPLDVKQEVRAASLPPRPAEPPPVAVPQTPGPPITPPAGLPQAEAKVAAMLSTGELSPSVRRMIEEYHLDLTAIVGSGEGGRITEEDVTGYLEAHKEAGRKAVPVSPLIRPPIPGSPAATPRQSRIPLSPIRQRIAERLVLSQRATATLTTFAEVDMSTVITFRKQYKEPFLAAHGVALGFMSFFVKATVDALKSVPVLMSYIDDRDLVQNQCFDIGIAVSTDRGLVVPVLRSADQKSFAEIEREIADLARKAREKRIALPELEGGVFTITNPGSYGALMGTPILSPPQSGILGTYAIKERAVAISGQVKVLPMMMLALSYDHRVVDGEPAGRFLQRVTEWLEDPTQELLEK